MKLKKILSSFLACTVLGTVSQICLAAEECLMPQEVSEVQEFALRDIGACHLGEGMNLAECQFTRVNDIETKVYKHKDGNVLWKSGNRLFAVFNGDEIWVNNGETEFVKPKDGMLSKEKLYSYATRWNAFPEAVLNIKGLAYDVNSQLFVPKQEQNNSYIWVPSFKTLFFTCSAVGLIYLVYKNIKLALSKNNQTHS